MGLGEEARGGNGGTPRICTKSAAATNSRFSQSACWAAKEGRASWATRERRLRRRRLGEGERGEEDWVGGERKEEYVWTVSCAGKKKGEGGAARGRGNCLKGYLGAWLQSNPTARRNSKELQGFVPNRRLRRTLDSPNLLAGRRRRESELGDEGEALRRRRLGEGERGEEDWVGERRRRSMYGTVSARERKRGKEEVARGRGKLFEGIYGRLVAKQSNRV
ncbi:hypothetical protein Droror1_Dr00026286 [Drosera rotundifolia]